MNDDYLDTFDARGDSYNEAARIHAGAREIERQILIELLRVERGHTICDAPAGGGYLADGLRPLLDDPAQILCVEPSARFADAIDPRYRKYLSPLDDLPIGEAEMDRVGSLAGLHHLGEKRSFFQEAYRALKRGGLFAVGDVLDGTPVARFLNGPVDRFTVTGHRGRFLKTGECARLFRESGFVDVREERRTFYWTFDSEEQMVQYCRCLFGLTKADPGQVAAALASHFEIERSAESVRLPWSLVFGVGVKH